MNGDDGLFRERCRESDFVVDQFIVEAIFIQSYVYGCDLRAYLIDMITMQRNLELTDELEDGIRWSKKSSD